MSEVRLKIKLLSKKHTDNKQVWVHSFNVIKGLSTEWDGKRYSSAKTEKEEQQNQTKEPSLQKDRQHKLKGYFSLKIRYIKS